VARARSGTFAEGRLVLTGAGETMVAFSDRPRRLVAAVSSPAVLAGLGLSADRPAAEPPNAALAVDGGPTTVVVLTAGAWDRAADTLTFDARVSGAGAYAADGRAAAAPAAFGPASLFVDDVVVSDAARGMNVTVINQTPVTLTVAAAGPVHGVWSPGQAPGGPLAPGAQVVWRAESGGFMTGAEALVAVTGAGSPPVQIHLDAPYFGTYLCQATGNDAVTATATDQTRDTGGIHVSQPEDWGRLACLVVLKGH
jgi:hypothetical protein